MSSEYRTTIALPVRCMELHGPYAGGQTTVRKEATVTSRSRNAPSKGAPRQVYWLFPYHA
jgi:hypothetical protein